MLVPDCCYSGVNASVGVPCVVSNASRCVVSPVSRAGRGGYFPAFGVLCHLQPDTQSLQEVFRKKISRWRNLRNGSRAVSHSRVEEETGADQPKHCIEKTVRNRSGNEKHIPTGDVGIFQPDLGVNCGSLDRKTGAQ